MRIACRFHRGTAPDSVKSLQRLHSAHASRSFKYLLSPSLAEVAGILNPSTLSRENPVYNRIVSEEECSTGDTMEGEKG